MCGIYGFNFKDDKLAQTMSDALALRGPDAEGVFCNGNVTIGHRRLSIIDLSSAANQPMSDREGDDWLVYNGEIYNFKKLRQDLESKGYEFKSNADSEVILYGWKEYGAKFFEQLEGMWSFCIYNKYCNQLILSRDYFGIKPLYYYWDEEKFIFASELKSLVQGLSSQLDIDWEAVNLFFSLGYVPAPKTIFKNVYKLRPGQTLVFTLQGKGLLQKQIQWLANKKSTEDVPSEASEKLLKSVQSHLLADVPVGLFLSGGVDSSIIALKLHELGIKIKTFTLAIKGKVDSDFAKTIVEKFNLDNETYEFDEDAFLEIAPDVWEQIDEPIYDTSFFPIFYLSKKASKSVKVVLGGEGGDEIFWGYPKYRILAEQKFKASFKEWSMVKNIVGKRFAKKIQLAYDIYWRRDFLKTYMDFSGPTLYGDNQIAYDFLAKYLSAGHVSNPAILDLNSYLPDNLLCKIDLATMRYSIEGRVPMLDKNIFNYIASLSKKQLFGKETKCILKSILRKKLGADFTDRQKEGFSTPLAEILYKHYENEIRDAIVFVKRNSGKLNFYPKTWVLIDGVNQESFMNNGGFFFGILTLYKVLKRYDKA